MKEEILTAVTFISEHIKKGNKVELEEEKLQEFSNKMIELLTERFQDHWYQDSPQKGQGYRCIRTNKNSCRDPVIEKAAEGCGLSYTDLNLPLELTIWVDPKEVSYRLGENTGSWCMLFKEGKKVEGLEGQMINVKGRSYNKPNSNNGTSNQNWYRNQPPPPPTSIHPPPHPPHHPPPQMRKSPPINLLKKKFRPHPPPLKFHHQFQQRISNVKNDRYHWVRGADLVKA